MKVSLYLLKNDCLKKRFDLPSAVTTIGRRQDCDLCIPLMVISRRHCEVNMDQGLLTIRDLDSRNGTFVNGERIEETILDPGDMIQIGPLKFIIQVDGVPADHDLPPQAHQASETAAPSGANTDLNRTEIIAEPPEEPYDDSGDISS